MAFDWWSLLGPAGSVFSAASAKKGQEEANRAEMEFNRLEAQKQRDFEERMFSTRFQTTRKDLEAAGINPLLMTGMNPSTPMGASAVAHPKSTRSEMVAILSQTAKMVAETNLTNALRKKAESEATMTAQDAKAYSRMPWLPYVKQIMHGGGASALGAATTAFGIGKAAKFAKGFRGPFGGGRLRYSNLRNT